MGEERLTMTGKRVLLAEDDASLRELYTELLGAEGLEVVAVADGLDAFEAFLSQGPFDAVISDCDLPRLSGPQLVERLRDLPSAVPALLMSGRLVLEPAVHQRLQLGRILRKPFGLDAFAQAIRRLFASRVA
jgi:CheY-like chemotaxis protein